MVSGRSEHHPMTVTREDLNPCTVKLTVTLDSSEVGRAFDRALKKAGKEIRVPGFRPGHAPKAMIERMVDPQRIAEEAADVFVRDTFPKAIEQEGLKPDPGTRPSVALESYDPEAKSATYSAKVPLPPVIELAEYKGVQVDQPDTEVSDEEIQFQIDELRKRKGVREEVSGRGLSEGDVAVVNIKEDGAEGDGTSFMTVVGQTFPALDEAITGMSTEELKTVELDFPEEFSNKALAGSTKKVQLSVNSASTVKLAELDDSLAQEFQAENVDELKAKMRESIANAKAQLGREMMQEQILEKLRAASTIHVSDNMWEALAGQRLSEIQQEQANEGKSIEQYAAENGMTLEELVNKWNEQAKIHVERAMVVRDIFEKESLGLTNGDLNTELFFMASEYNVQPQELLNQLQSNNALPELQFRAISRKVT
ncbi:trigger factor, partial [bacterium]